MNIQATADQFRIDTARINGLIKLGFSKAEIHQIVAPQRTLSRRKNRLSLDESDKVQRLEHILQFATQVFGEHTKANLWLRRANRALNGTIPIDLLVSETGARTIEMQLHAISHGMYA